MGKKSSPGYLTAFRGVLMTGGSSGIGYDILLQLKNLHPSIWIGNLSRSKPEGFSFSFQHFYCDLAGDPEERRTVFQRALQTFREEVPEGPLLLINNSGFGSYGAFSHSNLETHEAMMAVNVISPLILVGLADPILRERGGAIVNIASTAAFQPTPSMAVYGAGKAFLLNWSLALSQDYRNTGVHVMAVCPGPTETRFFKNAGFSESPVKGLGHASSFVARKTLEALAKRRTLVITGWGNRILTCLVAPLSKSWAAVTARWMLSAIRPPDTQPKTDASSPKS